MKILKQHSNSLLKLILLLILFLFLTGRWPQGIHSWAALTFQPLFFLAMAVNVGMVCPAMRFLHQFIFFHLVCFHVHPNRPKDYRVPSVVLSFLVLFLLNFYKHSLQLFLIEFAKHFIL